MPSPLLQLRIPQDLADWLEAKYPSRGEVAEYVRQLLTAEQMKEAVAPLVPEAPKRVWKGTAAEWAAFEEGAGFETPEETEILDRMHGITPEDFDAYKAEPKPKARRKKSVKDSPVRSGSEDKGDGSSFPAPAESPSLPRFKPQPNRTLTENLSRLPQRCNRGACTGTIKPNGRCIRCNQEPLKESK